MDILKKINWKQPKYMIPLIIYFPLLFVGYFVIDLFHTEKADIPDKNLATTEYLNPELPDAKMKGDGIGNKMESMARSYGQIDDFSAIDNIDRNNEEEKEEYNSKYTDAECKQLESQEAAKLAEMQRQLRESAQKGQEVAKDEVSVIITKTPCVLLNKTPITHTCQVDEEACKKCGMCMKPGCPAITKLDNGVTHIDTTMCNGCGLCKSQCKFGAIRDIPV